jgi:hypothetical protein
LIHNRESFCIFCEKLKRKTLEMLANNGDETTSTMASAASRQTLHPSVAPLTGLWDMRILTPKVLVISIICYHLHTD